MEPRTTAPPKSKGPYIICTWATKMRGNMYMILSTRDRLIHSCTCNLCLVYKRIGYYVSNKLLSVNKHRLYYSPASQQTLQPTKVQDPRNPTRKPILLPQKDSKSRWKRSRIEGKHLTNVEEGQRRHSRN